METPDFSVIWPEDSDEAVETNLTPPPEQPVSDGQEEVVLSVDTNVVPEFSFTKSILAARDYRCGRLIG